MSFLNTKLESFDEIVFENRNKEYGAFELRKKYSKRLFIAMLISFSILLFATVIPLLEIIIKRNTNNIYIDKTSTIEMLDIKNKDENIVIPPSVPQSIPSIKEMRFITPKIVDSISDQEVELANNEDVAESTDIGLVDTTIHKPELTVLETDPIDDKIFEMFGIEEKPLFPGGDAGLRKYVASHIRYPQEAVENRTEGTVYVIFVITKLGDVDEASVIRSVDQLLDNEALRVIKSLPRWIPGKNNGVPVSVWYRFPIKFTL